MIPVETKLRVKHRLATSPVGAMLKDARDLILSPRKWRHPELGLLLQEDKMIDAVVARHAQPDWSYLDVGAHIGAEAYKFRHLSPKGRVTMIEASPEKARMLQKRFPDMTCHQIAASDTEGEVSFFENLEHPGFNSLTNRPSRGSVREIRVSSRRLDDVIPPDDRVDFLKIDIEGHELPALRGASQLLKRCKPIILFEAGAANDTDFEVDPSLGLYDYLTTEHSYTIRAAFDVFYDRPPISREQFLSYRTYPFLAFNYFAFPDA